ncbi:MAG: citrate/2-methylcitrate synthase [Spirochaetales bacterium]|nr:citrate/2-methylcitrate synthase [Spirochaetales bacterium]
MDEMNKEVNKYAEIVYQYNQIDPALYGKFNVKRGLRNEDGSGVLVGLTSIGEVHGYVMDEGERTPVEGRLRYRGIDVSDLVKGCQKEGRLGFEETIYLLLFGVLPKNNELENFSALLGRLRSLPENFTENMILSAPSFDIMNKLSRSVLVSYSYDQNAEDRNLSNVLRQCIEMIARFPVFAAYGYQAKRHYYEGDSLFLHNPEPNLSTAENFLRMIRPDMTYTKLEAELLDLCLILHAEHGGGNNSAFAIHVVASADTDTYSSIAAAVGSLKGAKHGGANNKVMEMMDNIKSNVKNWADETEVREYLTKIINKEAYDKTGLVYGFGHAVYTLSDPRALILRSRAKDLAAEKGLSNEFNLYCLMEQLVPEVFNDVKKSGKVIAPNVDFFSGFVYSMLDIPRELYTPLFAISRIAGWSAHLIEEILNGGRIIRPAYKHVQAKREYIPLCER